MMQSVPRDHYVSAGFRLIRFRLILMLRFGLWRGGLFRCSLVLLLRRRLMLLRGRLRRSLVLLLRCSLMLRLRCYRLGLWA